MGRLSSPASRQGRKSGNDGDRRDKSRKAVKRSSTGDPKQSISRNSPQKKARASPKAAKPSKTSSPSKKSKTPARVVASKLKGRAKASSTKKKPNQVKRPQRPARKTPSRGKRETVKKTKKVTSAKGATKKGKTVAKAKGASVSKTVKKRGKTSTETKKASSVKETKGKGKKAVIHPNSRLTPNLNIKVVDKDPMFEVKNETEIPKVSDYVNCKRSIRAVLTKDNALLKKLINNTKEIPSLFVMRSVCLKEDALDYALKTENTNALKLLIKEDCASKERKEMPVGMMKHQGTGRYNYRTFGHAVREINMSRGGREGNNAFTKDLEIYPGFFMYEDRYEKAVRRGMSPDTLKLLCSLYIAEKNPIEYEMTSVLHHAVRAGHHVLAGELIKQATSAGGYGFNKLHQEVLLATKPEQLSPFRAVSVIKKATENDKITPLHCAAINPNPKILSKLLSFAPNVYVPDHVGFMPIHYAAACEGSGPLELLLNRGAKAEEFQPKTMVTPLMIAAKYGREQNIEILIKNIKSAAAFSENEQSKTVVDRKDKKGHSAIHFAAEGGHVDCVRSLVKHGADVEAMESAVNNKLTPLMVAAERGHFKLVKVLIDELGAVIEKRDKIKRTSLMLACMNGQYPVATLLLRKGADPNAKDSSGNSPVHYAAAYGWWHCLKLLLQAGGDPNTFNDWKVPPLGVAYLKGHFGCADLLLKQPVVDVNFRDENGATLLLKTCEQNMTASTMEQLKYLVKKGADVLAQTINDQNALHLIALHNQQSEDQIKPNPLESSLKVIEMFMDKGCDPGQKDNNGKTPISIALQNGHPEYLKTFLVKGQMVSLDADKSEKNPLHHMAEICSSSQVAIIKILAGMDKTGNLEEAAKMKDNQGCTPFLRCILNHAHHISDEHVFAMLKALIDLCKSDINACVDEGPETAPHRHACSCALHILAAYPPSKALSLIMELKPELDVLNVDGYTPLLLAINARQTQTIQTLLSEGADPNTGDKFQHHALLMAVRKNLPDIIPDLIAEGASLDHSLFKNGQPSIMHYAPAYIGDLEAKVRTVEKLVAAGASLDAVDDENRTVLHNAVNAIQSHLTTELLEFLLDQNVDIFPVDNFGRLPIHYALYKYNPFGDDSPLRGGQFNNTTDLDPIEIVSMLAAAMNGKKMNVQDKYGRTPLHYAAYRGAMICAMHICEWIDDIDVEDQDGHTPLSLAVLNGKQSMAIWLIQRGANFNRELTLVGLEASPKDDAKRAASASDPSQSSSPSTTPPKYWTWKAVADRTTPKPQAKTTIFQAVVYEEWQGAVYVMMDRITNFGISYPDAIEAVLTQQNFQLANEFIRKLREPRKLQTTNSKSQNLLHLLAIHAEGGSSLQARIATALLRKGVKLFVPDYKGCTPVHYAAVNKNAVLCDVFAEQDPVSFQSCITCADKRGRVPIVSLFWGLSYSDNTSQIIQLIKKHKGSLDVCAAFPNVNLLCKEKLTRSESLQDWYHNLPDDKTTDVTPLIFTILMNNFEGCKLLLQKGASPNAADRDGMTPVMHAVKQNELALVSALLNPSFEPEKVGMKKVSGSEVQMSPWTSNIWREKKSGSYSSTTRIAIGEGYVVHEDEDQTAKPKSSAGTQPKPSIEVDLNATDSFGRTAVHHLMKTCDFGTYENEEILKKLAGKRAKLVLQDRRGKTPLDYTMETGSKRMATALQGLLKVAPRQRVYPRPVIPGWSDGLQFPPTKPDVDNDSKAMVALLEAERSKTCQEEDFTPKVDEQSGMQTGGVVVMDDEQNIGYDIIMTKVQVEYGRYGLNNFYRMQVIHQLGKDMFVLFTRWGRIGDTGQFQKTPFGTKEDAIAEFKKIFKAKSGNEWANAKSFVKKPGKYLLVQMDPWRAKRNDALKDFQFDLDSPVPSKLPEDIQHVLHELTKPQTLKSALEGTKVDTSVMNFSHLSRDVLQKANDVLDKISEVIEKVNCLPGGDIKEILALREEIYALSNEYYYLIPHENFAHDMMCPVDNARDLNSQKSKLYSLMEIEMINRILLGATLRKKEMNPLDYIYRALDCKLKLMDKNDEETQHVLQYIHQSSNDHPPKVEAIFRLSREGEEERLQSCGLDNHKLLWHGSRTVNLLSILKKGLKISPIEAQLTGDRFGEGIYTSDAFCKSLAYCRSWEDCQPSHFMLLCEVALGKTADQNVRDSEEKKKFNSTFVTGRNRSNGKRELFLPSGVSLPLGWITSDSGYCYTDYNEYVAYTEEQVCLRYLVHMA